MLGSGALHQGAGRLHDELLLGEGHLLPAVEQAHSQIRLGVASDGTLLPVDTFHSTDPGEPTSPSVCVSVTFRYCIKTAKRRIT